MAPFLRCCAAAVLVLLSSCVSMIRMDQLQAIHKGMSHADLTAMLQRQQPSETLAVEMADMHYSTDVYEMQTGTKTVSVYVWGPYGGYTSLQQVPTTSGYFFLFDDKSLVFWGFLNEFQKSDDPTIQQLAPLIQAAYDKATAARRAEPPTKAGGQ